MHVGPANRSSASTRLLAGFWIGPWLWTLQDPAALGSGPMAAPSAPGVIAARGEGGELREPLPAEMTQLVEEARRRLAPRGTTLEERDGRTAAGGVKVDLSPDIGAWLVAARDAVGRVLVECAHAEATAGDPLPGNEEPR